MKKEAGKRRSFLKHMLAGTVVVAGVSAATKPAKAQKETVSPRSDEILYRESEAFTKYYKSLRS